MEFKPRMLIYIAGPLNDKLHEEASRNIETAIEYGNKILDKGHLIYIPHFSYYLHQKKPREHFWYNYDLTIMSICDALFMFPNWKDSKGAILENTKAREWGMKIYESLDEIYTTSGGIYG